MKRKVKGIQVPIVKKVVVSEEQPLCARREGARNTTAVGGGCRECELA